MDFTRVHIKCHPIRMCWDSSTIHCIEVSVVAVHICVETKWYEPWFGSRILVGLFHSCIILMWVFLASVQGFGGNCVRLNTSYTEILEKFPGCVLGKPFLPHFCLWGDKCFSDFCGTCFISSRQSCWFCQGSHVVLLEAK